MLAYLWDSGLSAIAADNPAVEATPFELTPESWPYGFLHQCLIGQLGMAIGELWWLHDLVSSCRKDSKYEVFLTAAPMNLAGAIGSPANALAFR
jgi:kynurenine formamidase